MILMRADPLRGQMGGGWTLEIETFLGPVKWHRAVRRVPFPSPPPPPSAVKFSYRTTPPTLKTY